MDKLSELLEALLMSLAVVGTAALHMALAIPIIFCALVLIGLVRWAGGIIINMAIATFKRERNKHG